VERRGSKSRPAERAPAAGAIERAVGVRDVPASVRALGSLPAIDYADLFTLATPSEATPEGWARAMFGNVPSPVERLIWRGLLGLRLAEGRSPATVGGWRIGARGTDWIRLEAASASLTCNLLVQTAEGQVSLATFLQYERRLGRRIWPPLSAIHRRLVPGVLRDAAARVSRRSIKDFDPAGPGGSRGGWRLGRPPGPGGRTAAGGRRPCRAGWRRCSRR
jgi:hypothetical protein